MIPPQVESEELQPVSVGKQVFDLGAAYGVAALTWPLSNLWLGTSVEDQPRADQRIPQRGQPGRVKHRERPLQAA